MSTFFANNLSFLRKKKGLTQAEVATALGLKRNTFSNYETTHSEPDLGTLERIASFFDISIDELISVDLSKSNLIEYREEDVDKEKSNPKSNVSGNLTSLNRQYLPPADEDLQKSPVAEKLL